MPRKSWWARLPFGVRMTAGTGVLLVLVGGAGAGIAALTRDDKAPQVVTALGQAAAAAPPAGHTADDVAPRRPAARVPLGEVGASAPRTSDKADRTATRNPRPRKVQVAAPGASSDGPAPPVAPAGPVTTTRTETETRPIPFETRLVPDPKLPPRRTRVDAPGVPGEETLHYLVTLTNGQPTERKLIDATVTRQPQHRVVAYGSRRSPKCRDSLHVCVPLGRLAICPKKPTNPKDRDADEAAGSAGGLAAGGLAAGGLAAGDPAAGDPAGDEQSVPPTDPAEREEGLVTMLDTDLALLDDDELAGLEQLTCHDPDVG